MCPTSVDPEHPDSYYSVSDRLAREVPGAWKPDQYHNPDNPLAQYETTGPEIWEQTRGRITHFVCGVGTGGTITGIGRYLKERNPAIRTIGADPEGSVYSGGTGRPYLVEGIGEDFWPTTYDPSVVDEVIPISDAVSFGTARRVTREEGLLIGGSGGTAIAAALQGRRRAPARRGGRRAHPRLRPRLPVEALRRRVDGRPRVPARRRAHRRRPAARAATRRSPRSCTPTPTRPCARPSRSCASSR